MRTHRAILGGLAVFLSFVASAQTAPSAPMGLAAAPLDASASLSWTDPSDSAITGYSVRSATSTTLLAAASWQAISGSGATTTSHTVGSLTNGTRYYFQIRATNAQGDSAASNTATIQLATSPSTAVNIPDDNLRAALETATGRSSGQTITQLDMAKLTGTFNANSLNISAVTGLEHAVNITALYLETNSISDVAPLGSLTALTTLLLEENFSISDVTPLGTLTALTWLELGLNSISDVTPLGSLTALTLLDLSGNSISDVTPLGTLTALTWLQLDNNSISDVTPLGTLTALTSLELANNSISNATALGSLTALRWLVLNNNSISDVTPLGSLTALETLYLVSNSITDVTVLGTLTALTFLHLSFNSISDVTPLGTLTALESLYLSGNSITDATPLGTLTALERLFLLRNPLNSLADVPLASFRNLSNLGLSGRWISNSVLASIVASNHSLSQLELLGGSITDVTPLANLAGVFVLDLSDNSISDISPLLTIFRSNPTYIDLRRNPLSAASVNTHIPDIRRRYSPAALYFDPLPDTDDADETDDPPTLPPVGNQSPSVSGELPALELDVGETAVVALGAAFDDADDDPLRYTASAAGGFVSVRIDGGIAHVTGERPGKATVTVTAEDPAGLEATTTFRVTVGASLSVEGERITVPEGGTVVVALELSRPLSAPIAVRWHLVADGDASTADADIADYDEPTGEVSIPAGRNSATIEVAIIDDADIEPAREHFVVQVEQPEDENVGLARDARVEAVIQEGVCDRTPAIRDELSQGWRGCHWPKPTTLAAVRSLDLSGRNIDALRTNDLLGLHGLRRLDLSNNALAMLPAGLFTGMEGLREVSVEGNPGAPFALTVELARLDAEPWAPGPAQLVARTAWAAPFSLAATLSASPADAVAGELPEMVEIAAGAMAGQPFSAASNNGAALALRTDAAPLPTAQCGDHPCFRGFQTVPGPALTLFRQPPRALPSPTLEPLQGGDELRLPLASLVEAADPMEELRWQATSSDEALATVRIVDGSLVVTPELATAGTVEVTLVVTDTVGFSATLRFEVRVEFHWPRSPTRGWRSSLMGASEQ